MDLSNLSTLSLPDLRALQSAVDAELKLREKAEIQKAREQILAIANTVGIDLKQLVGVKPAKAAKLAGEIKYRDPANAKHQWTGKGRQPNWIKSALAVGRSLQEFAA